MTHYVCRGGCGGQSDELGVCEADGCSSQWEMLEACECTDGVHGVAGGGTIVKDSNGNVINDGDDVILTKDLDVKGSSLKLKRGDVIKKVRLIAGDCNNVEFKAGKSTMVLKTCFMKKA